MKRYEIKFIADREKFTHTFILNFIGQGEAPTYKEFKAELLKHVGDIIDNDLPEFDDYDRESYKIIEVAVEKLDPARWKQVPDDCIKIQYDEQCFYTDKTLKENMTSIGAWRRAR